MPAKFTVAATPPIVTRGRDTLGAAPENNLPAGTAGFVGPNPTPNRSSVSPAFTGRVGNDKTPVGPIKSYPAPLFPGPVVGTIAAAYLLLYRLKEGAYGPSVTLDEALPALVVTTTFTVPVAASSGACALIWPGLTNHK